MKTSLDLLKLNDIDFLKEIVARYPETHLLSGQAEAPPEGNQKLKENPLAYQVFQSVHPEAIEADRTFLGLLLLKATASLGLPNAYSVIVAMGVDAPPYADEVLLAGNAKRMTFTSYEAKNIVKSYTDCRMDGNDESRFGKTALTWQAALQGERGEVKLAIPEKFVNGKHNPWNPIVDITDEMADVYVMTLTDHLRAINE